jgi:UDP-N-acetylglucosamine--N-acetylmuramyl-(pentapeptide) pyrophosphoryl-undecaprenol N-acetylglucosamine transferase
VIGYYIHHHGRGHLTRAETVTEHLSVPVVALTSLHLAEPGAFHSAVALARDDVSTVPRRSTAGDRLHWAPVHDDGLRERMATIAAWIADARPDAIVVDVSVEITAFVRLMGVPTIVMAMPGERVDAAHRLAYDLADHIIAAWPRELYEPGWLRPHLAKTTYAGGVSRFGERTPDHTDRDHFRVTILNGAGGTSLTEGVLNQWRCDVPDVEWTVLGGPGARWKDDPWFDLCTSSVVISHAGQNAVADIAAAGTPAIVIPEHRPFDEQSTTARVLDANALAVVRMSWPTSEQLPAVLDLASSNTGHRWACWETAGAADRVARAIEGVLDRGGSA